MFVQTFWESVIHVISVPPGSLFFILFVSICVSLISTLLNRWLLDTDQLNRQQDIIQEHNKWKKELEKMAEENPKKYAKEYVRFQRRDAGIQKMQQKMSLTRMKPMCITTIPLILMFYVIRNLYVMEGAQIPVAIPPMNPWDIPYLGKMMWATFNSTIRDIPASEGLINFTSYYFLCSLSVSTIIQKLFGIQKATGGLGGGGGFGDAFSSQNPLPKPTQ
jgi:uncharacterized membrane protein (DUF106 family)